MIINPVTVTMPRHELEMLKAAATKRLSQLKGDNGARRILEQALDSLDDQLATAAAVRRVEAR